MQAWLQGQRVGNNVLTAAEKAAQEFQTIEGIGESTAMALALTEALGGRQLTSLAALHSWAGTEANCRALQQFLLYRQVKPHPLSVVTDVLGAEPNRTHTFPGCTLITLAENVIACCGTVRRYRLQQDGGRRGRRGLYPRFCTPSVARLQTPSAFLLPQVNAGAAVC